MTSRHRGDGGAIGVAFTIVALLLVAGIGLGGALVVGRSQLDAPSPLHGAPVAIDVRPGEALGGVVDDLETHHLLRNKFWFAQYARYQGLEDALHPGRFLLDNGMGSSAIIAKLRGRPDIQTKPLVLAEGLTAAEMAAAVERGGFGITAAQYLQEVRTGVFSEPFLGGRPAGASLEGFLFPDTYSIPANVTAHSLIQIQLDTFAAKGVGALLGSKSSLSTYQLVVLASLVEREARAASDRPLVAGVVVNRLAAGMLLQVDAAVLYGAGVSGRSPTADELGQDTPYNTYLHAGLPVTPIANPGRAALAAAANPAQTAYLFYVSDACGHNHYSTTLADHQQAVARFVGKPCR